MKIYSWNVNGIRACVKKDAYFSFLDTHNPDILFLQETKAHVVDIPDNIQNPTGYYGVWHSAEKKGYSSVAMITKHKPKQVFEGMGNEKYDCEGRVVGAEFDKFVVFGVYFPNGSQSPERLQYKFDFYQDFFAFCQEFRAEGKNVIICGDYNTAHNEIDLARPKENQGNSGFMPKEREWMDKVIDEMGYIDTFREFHKEPERYSWWSYRTAARKRNIGWRIDYVMTNKDFKPYIKDAEIHDDVLGSDHCPVSLTISV
ncbi:exodeoxyribonuclease III [Candidatus Marinamargulisbacteria bacterium SCGC AAA071-K20]|nr:exodeoxyribonuclease III [Candidatus Marinamargulisbacteria bacterium SCGC AAA071-K20]